MSKASPPFPLVEHLLPEAFPSTLWHQSCILISTSQRHLRDLCSNRDLRSSSTGNAPTPILSLRVRVKKVPPVENSQQAQQGGSIWAQKGPCTTCNHKYFPAAHPVCPGAWPSRRETVEHESITHCTSRLGATQMASLVHTRTREPTKAVPSHT